MNKPFKIDQYEVNYHDKDELLHLKNEIFVHHCYYFETTVTNPKIIDAGAHIGLATLYFKKLFPFAEITAIEPQPISFKLLEQNVLADSKRKLLIDPLKPKLPIGPFKAKLEISLNEEGALPVLSTEISFWYLPYKIFFGFLLALVVVFLFKKRKNKLKASIDKDEENVLK